MQNWYYVCKSDFICKASNYYTREVREEWENPAIGIILCADKNEAMVRFTLPEGENNIFAAQYKLYLPTEEEILNELKREQDLLRQIASLS